jgi:hypothetical protein
VPFERWEAMVFSPEGPIVWGQDRYADTGIRPSVHELGARIPSLRRLERKWPYFTNGSARSLAELLAGVRTGGETTLHASAEDPTQRALSAGRAARARGVFVAPLSVPAPWRYGFRPRAGAAALGGTTTFACGFFTSVFCATRKI